MTSGRRRRPVPRIQVHRSAPLADEITSVRGVPVTTVPRTLLDLAAITHVLIGGRSIECDCAWREQRVLVELDSHAVHATTAAFERDRARDRALQAEGWQIVRITWRQLHLEAAKVAADLRKILARARP